MAFFFINRYHKIPPKIKPTFSTIGILDVNVILKLFVTLILKYKQASIEESKTLRNISANIYFIGPFKLY